MTMQSLQNIIKIENELHANEQTERKKISQWLKEKETEIDSEYAEKRNVLSDKREEIKKRIGEEAAKRASDIVNKADKRAVFLTQIDDDTLCRYLQQCLTSILSGKFP